MACPAKSNGGGEAAQAGSHNYNVERLWVDDRPERRHAIGRGSDYCVGTAAGLAVIRLSKGTLLLDIVRLRWQVQLAIKKYSAALALNGYAVCLPEYVWDIGMLTA